ncbi:MAG: DUF4258 domain-containing protein [Deltaproteobacteria bacterium]|jgi:hypothetical protein|nr:DUF4258 domain-containing protein [Deltaproteobacteria bacterium]
MKMQWIKEQVEKGNYQLKLHAVERASIRGIDPLEVKEALLNGEIIEDYPEDKRGHSCLVCGKTRIGRDIHVLCAMWYGL